MTAPAEQLRAAATKIRDTAAKATPGPWENHNDGDRLVHIDKTTVAGFTYVVDEPMSHAGNAEWIALMSPAVAEPLADMLLTAAREWPAIAYKLEGSQALALARAVLGEAP